MRAYTITRSKISGSVSCNEGGLENYSFLTGRVLGKKPSIYATF
jgi:hypothetical protein